MTEKDYEIARLFRSRLSGKVRLVNFRAFGSRARGDAKVSVRNARKFIAALQRFIDEDNPSHSGI